MKEHRTIRFFGNVQGVGFRYRALREAGGYDLEGYVRNMPDGSVEVVVEGERADIDGFIQGLESRMSGFIRRKSEQKGPYSGTFGPFEVGY